MDYKTFHKFMMTVYNKAMSDDEYRRYTFFRMTAVCDATNDVLYDKMYKAFCQGKRNKTSEDHWILREDFDKFWNTIEFSRRCVNIFDVRYNLDDDDKEENTWYRKEAYDKALTIKVMVDDWTKYCSLEEFIEHAYSIMHNIDKYGRCTKSFQWRPEKGNLGHHTKEIESDNIFDFEFWPLANWNGNFTEEKMEYISTNRFWCRDASVRFGPSYGISNNSLVHDGDSIGALNTFHIKQNQKTKKIIGAFNFREYNPYYDFYFDKYENIKLMTSYDIHGVYEEATTEEEVDFVLNYIFSEIDFARNNINRVIRDNKKRKILLISRED